jgi:hypothetical protein
VVEHLRVFGHVGFFQLRWLWTAAADKDERHGES